MTKERTIPRRLLLVGAATRLAGAALIVGLLWAGFFWAIATPGAP